MEGSRVIWYSLPSDKRIRVVSCWRRVLKWKKITWYSFEKELRPWENVEWAFASSTSDPIRCLFTHLLCPVPTSSTDFEVCISNIKDLNASVKAVPTDAGRFDVAPQAVPISTENIVWSSLTKKGYLECFRISSGPWGRSTRVSPRSLSGIYLEQYLAAV